ncbi:type II secretion system F family protein [Campylobacter vulpis]|uniref:Type II secretion system F family protein n=1 Tax=Campylobacter vulpis TaxID=1655500 RepID=A0ABS5P5I2_9BACT|nr:type II secretion system F family protein [Campylobacter vulpis]MBS4241754.1 type II secretion system F family protein [Campylobacter vulpis]MBS4252335.1 type II secretion system F family protein [Campylobacter vulpis]MBS4269759.1 type II secretion system F family protein [Campylobacter vulpis]MBS4275990.1 type II secretion system F family protein [Campylobacter vulpis]MBS4281624.1 type II secretion system F family protein [Campylobacter vulpis]
MKTYELYYLKNQQKLRKILKAKNLNTAQAMALRQNLQILSLKELKKQNKIKISDTLFCAFFKEFALLLNAGLSIKEALSLMSESSSKGLKDVVKELNANLNLGQSLSVAFSSLALNLSLSELSLIKMSEKTGNLAHIFSQIAELRTRLILNKKRFKKAIHYPCLVLLALFGAFLFLMFFVVPEFLDIFESLGANLPLITQILLSIYVFLSENYLLLICVFVGFCGAFVLSYKRSVKFAFWVDFMLLKFPFFSRFILYHQNYYFFMIFSLLLQSGNALTHAFHLASSSVKNYYIKEKFKHINTSLEQGLELSLAFKKAGIFDELVISLLHSAMKSGTLDTLSAKIAHFYEEKQEDFIEIFLKFLEPLMTLLVGILVLFLALGIFLPIWELSGGV